jgi:hypothetical protein
MIPDNLKRKFTQSQKKIEIKIKDSFDILDNSTKIDFDPIIPDLQIEGGAEFLLVAPGGTGKTFLLMDMMIKSVVGEAIFPNGEKPKKEINALFLDYETGEKTYKRRLVRLCHNKNYDYNMLKRLNYCNFEHKLNSPEIMEALEEIINYRKINLLVIDNLRAATSEKMNDQQAAEPLTRLRAVAQRTGCAVIMVHHTSKSGSEHEDTAGSGTQAFTDSVETKLVMKKDGEYINVVIGKMNNYAPKPFAFKISDIGDFDSKTQKTAGIEIEYITDISISSSNKKEKVNYKERILETLDGKQLTKTEIIEKTIGKKIEKYKAINELIESGEISEENGIFEIKEAAE